jgi:threonine synthase
MRYISTRGLAPTLGFSDVLLAGLANDGGLYVPQSWPVLTEGEIAALAGLPYAEAAFRIVRPYIGGEIADRDLARMCRTAYARFDRPEVAPLTRLAQDRYVVELFHGPTLAFKDVAMQLLAQLMDHVLAERSRRTTIIGATSGDTGAAAIEAFRNHDNIDVFILFPEGRVSPFQQRQMTTVGASNIHPIAIRGTFDDCQTIVKGMFANAAFRDAHALSGVNSINWARILGQIVYYFTAAVALGAPRQRVSFSVPTGNFGDIFAGYAAKRMGLGIDKLVIATNVNDILARALETGRYEVRTVVATSSPSMDIQVSSNFERLLFEAYDRDPAAVRRLMQDLAARRSFSIDAGPLARIRADFAAGHADEAAVAKVIAETYRATGFLPDPHTAVGLAVAERFAQPGQPMVTLATAHPAKFAAAVKAAVGLEAPLPAGFADIFAKREDYATIANDQKAVEDHVAALSRAATEKA